MAKGFQLLTPERRKEIAAMGGRAVPAHQRGFAKNPALARAAAKKSLAARTLRAKMNEP